MIMNASIFVVCDYAQSYNGKTTIIGTFNQIHTSKFPFLQNFYLVAKIVFDKDYKDSFTISFIGPDAKEFTSKIESSFDIKVPEHKKVASDIIVNLNNTMFNVPGTYTIELNIGDDFKESLEFYVIEK